MTEFECGVGVSFVRFGFGVKPHRVFEVILTRLAVGFGREQTFNVCLKRSGGNLVCRFDKLILRKRQSFIPLIKNLISDLTLNRLQILQRVVQNNIARNAPAIGKFFAQKPAFVDADNFRRHADRRCRFALCRNNVVLAAD